MFQSMLFLLYSYTILDVILLWAWYNAFWDCVLCEGYMQCCVIKQKYSNGQFLHQDALLGGSVGFRTEPVRWDVGVFLWFQGHGLWDNKEVEMPDFFKKLKRKTEKNKMTGGSRRREENTSRRIPFFSLQASYTSFLRRQRAESPERQGNLSIWKWIGNIYTYTDNI